jgi:G3E family GTPase
MMAAEPTGERIPISLVTGFLGSGKTTLIAALLKQPAMAGTAVIVNEFGAVGIDDAVFAQSIDAENVRLLANGCLCCTAGDDLAATVWTLARRPDRPRKIVIETTGLADPVPVLQRLMVDPRLAQTTRLDTVVATIDAVSGLKNLDRQHIAARQCAVADRRVITKSDIAVAADVELLRKRLRELNPGALTLQIEHGCDGADHLFGASLFNSGSGRAHTDRWLNLEEHRAENSTHDHDIHGVGTWLVEERTPVDWDALSPRLGEIVRRHGDLLLRVKGVIHTVGDPRPLVIHGVQRLFHPPVRLSGWPTVPSTSIVVIGDDGAAQIIRRIREALAEAAKAAMISDHREKLIA